MLREIKNLLRYTIAATDGTIGHVEDFYFDDEAWFIRYLVVETGKWLAHRRVLISPLAVDQSNLAFEEFPTRLTREQVRNSPDIDTDKPVSRQHERDFSSFYGYPFYWGSGGFWEAAYFPAAMLTGTTYGGSDAQYLAAQEEIERTERASDQRRPDDNHLRSCNAVTGHRVIAMDGEVGAVQGMLVDETSWAIRFFIVNTSHWWLGHQVLIAPEWITGVSWPDRSVTTDLTRDSIQQSPPYDPLHLPDRLRETRLYDHYGRPGYWQADRSLPTSARPQH